MYKEFFIGTRVISRFVLFVHFPHPFYFTKKNQKIEYIFFEFRSERIEIKQLGSILNFISRNSNYSHQTPNYFQLSKIRL